MRHVKTFDPARPATWTWVALNAWLLSVDDLGALRRALAAERRRGKATRPGYVRRIYARYAKVQRQRDRATLLGGLDGQA